MTFCFGLMNRGLFRESWHYQRSSLGSYDGAKRSSILNRNLKLSLDKGSVGSVNLKNAYYLGIPRKV